MILHNIKSISNLNVLYWIGQAKYYIKRGRGKMAEAVKLKVDINVYKQTLDQLQSVLNDLEHQRDALQSTIDSKMGGENFSGSDVEKAIEQTRKQKEYVQNAINKVRSQREAIMRSLNIRETSASQLDTDISGIDQSLPDIFKNS